MFRTQAIILSAVGLGLAACASSAELQSAPPSFEARVQASRPVPTPTLGSIAISPEIARACDLPTPKFAFDSSAIRGDAAGALHKLAVCFTTGPLRGRGMALVGHADPRGETEYNFALGQRRAGSVASFLEASGLSSARITTTSRGELDAIGTDEASWAEDRRVDVGLAK